ncbi:polysaccharide deacetylase family protein [uncultured Gelidibacter sp.]|uniref:polysaccharide deacetylase family protein n=1 Tax=uncultured Gelidibacter sp. TaxID=259318 RepID=UPI002633F2B1|nr:polysaccharide deacetylase family protein [uncultured Gelidibacter sp.]
MKHVLSIALLTLMFYGCKDQNTQEKQEQPAPFAIETSSEDLTDAIQINTIQVGSETTNDKNRFHTSYPSTAYDFINTHQEAFAQAYLKEFQKNIKDDNEKAVAGLDFGQHFEIIESTPSILAFLIERYTSYGNNYNTQYFTHLYDLEENKRLEFSNLFYPQENFDKLANIVKSKTTDILTEKINAMEGLTDSDRTALMKSTQEMIAQGTEPTNKNYHAFSWDASGNLTIYFDKYQVASGDHGNIEVQLAPETYKDLVAKKYQYVFHIKAEETDIATPIIKDTTTSQKVFDIDCSKEPCVAITFDDGPAKHTSQLLDILKEHGVKATFFVLGKSAKIQKNTLLRAYKEGHQIGNHSWDHKDLKKLSEPDILNQIQNTNEAISEITGADVHVMRPPYGSFNEIVKNKAGMPIILWNLDPLDWKDRNPEIVAQRMSDAKTNGIVLAHDIHKSTVEAMPAVIKSLKAKGYHLVTIDNLFSEQPLANGKVYNSRHK